MRSCRIGLIPNRRDACIAICVEKRLVKYINPVVDHGDEGRISFFRKIRMTMDMVCAHEWNRDAAVEAGARSSALHANDVRILLQRRQCPCAARTSHNVPDCGGDLAIGHINELGDCALVRDAHEHWQSKGCSELESAGGFAQRLLASGRLKRMEQIAIYSRHGRCSNLN